MEAKQWNEASWFASNFNRTNWIAPKLDSIIPPQPQIKRGGGVVRRIYTEHEEELLVLGVF